MPAGRRDLPKIESVGTTSRPSGSDAIAQAKSFDHLPIILTLKQAAEVLAVDRRTLYSQIRSGKLRAFKIGNSYRLERDALLSFIRADRPHSIRR